MSTITFHTAVDLYKDCSTPVDCFYLFQCTNSAAWTPDSLRILARACVFRMYSSRLLTLNCVKSMFLFKETSISRTGLNLADAVRSWIQRVGQTDETLHWCSTSYYACISRMYKTSASELASFLSFGTVLDHEARGIMEVMFAVSCFRASSFESMGSLFWIFVNELIRVKVKDVDHFNLLLWGQTLPQTVLVLAPVVFVMDSMLPGIEHAISIEGTANPNADTPTNPDYVRRSTIVVPSNTSMVFFNSVRILSVNFKRLVVPYFSVCERCITMTTPVSSGRIVWLANMEMFEGGIHITNYESVNCLGLTIHEAKTGVSVKRVQDFFFGSGGREPPVLEKCELAFFMEKVNKAYVEDIRLNNIRVAFDVSVSELFEVKRAAMIQCGSLGRILMKPGNNPLFHGIMFNDTPHQLLFGEKDGLISPAPIFHTCLSTKLPVPEEV